RAAGTGDDGGSVGSKGQGPGGEVVGVLGGDRAGEIEAIGCAGDQLRGSGGSAIRGEAGDEGELLIGGRPAAYGRGGERGQVGGGGAAGDQDVAVGGD